jgi:hypothetical protein
MSEMRMGMNYIYEIEQKAPALSELQ